MRGIGSSSRASPLPNQGATRRADSSLVYARTSSTPETARVMSAALRTSDSMSRPATGRTWIVTSRPTSDRQSLAALTTSITAPAVSAARKVMMATTAVSDRPAIEFCGTIAVATCGPCERNGLPSISSHGSASGSTRRSSGSLIDMKPSLVQHQAPGVVFVHQGDIVSGDEDSRSGLVELDEKAKQALAEVGIDVAGRFVGQQKLRTGDHGAGDGGALLLAAGKDRRQRIDALAKTHPFQQFHDLGPIGSLLLAEHAQRQCHVLVGRHVVEQPEVLEHDADPPAQRCPAVLAQGRGVVVEHRDQAARRPQ